MFHIARYGRLSRSFLKLLLSLIIIFGLTSVSAKADDCSGTWIGLICLGKLTKPSRDLAQSDSLLKIRHESKLALNPDELYEVAVSCSSASLPGFPDWQPFVEETLTSSHIVALTDKKLGSAELPKEGRALITVFSVAGNRKNHQDFINNTCSTDFLLSGRETLFLGATANQTTSNAPGAVSTAITRLIQIAIPIAPLLKVASGAVAAMTGVAATDDPLKKLFSELDKGQTRTISENLTQGKNIIETRYSRVTVTVSKIKSVIGIKDLVQPFENSVEEAKNTLKIATLADAELKQKCAELAAGLRNRNLSPADVSYALVFLTRLASLDKPRTMFCIGPVYALPALEHEKLWHRFGPLVYSPSDAKTAFASTEPLRPIQPEFKAVLKQLQNAIRFTGRYLQTSQRDADSLKSYFSDSIQVSNVADFFSSDLTDALMSRSDFLTLLVKNEFLRVGCMTSDTEALALVLAFKVASVDQNRFADKDAVALRVWFDDSLRIYSIKIEHDDALVEKALTARGSRSCGDGNLSVAALASQKDAEAPTSLTSQSIHVSAMAE